ncbi:polyhydroxybutyrate depolymerase [Paracoccus sp. Z330]|uniref:Polyhydroxybutyrate depolymerase n=1 Tax=Paracoccus onchidii TaxID=3017813 RepID=A0ABT4ZKI5_9RHOB|nr:polyhydroxybutyrate depolymerase [Paracoccus onchidii]MDB6179513.1 polyhydroxybutyrate depolymerase [Paracoccus onchidii]
MFRCLGAICAGFAALFLSRYDAQAQGCGSAERACMVKGGSYHLTLPDNTKPKGIVIYLHGGGATGKSLMNSDLATEALRRAYMFVAPNGEHPENRWTKDWSVHAGNMQFERDDIAFLNAVLADARDHGQMTDGPVLLAGFSRGGSMVWNMACDNPDFATTYAPLAGAFWNPLPERCEGPVTLFHTHGWTDRTVPLEGRSFFDGAVVQGDVWASLGLLRQTNGCHSLPDSSSFVGDFWLRHWGDCDAGQIDLLLHKGGHGAPDGWAALIMDWFEEAQLRNN